MQSGGRVFQRKINVQAGPLGEGFLTPETVAEVAVELVALSEILEELEAEEAATGT